MAVRLQNEIYEDTKLLDKFSMMEIEERIVRIIFIAPFNPVWAR